MLLNCIMVSVDNCCWKCFSLPWKALAAFGKSLECYFQTSSKPHLARGPCVLYPCFIAYLPSDLAHVVHVNLESLILFLWYVTYETHQLLVYQLQSNLIGGMVHVCISRHVSVLFQILISISYW